MRLFLTLLVATFTVMSIPSCSDDGSPTCPESPDLLTELTTGWWHHTRDLIYNDLGFEYHTQFSADTDTMRLILHQPDMSTPDACYKFRYQFSEPDTIRFWTANEVAVHYTFRILYSDSGEPWMATKEPWGRSLRERTDLPDFLAGLCDP